MLSRRDFLRRAAIVAAGAVAADQLELLDRLGWTRSLFPSIDTATYPEWKYLTDASGSGMFVTQAQWDALLRSVYVRPVLLVAPPHLRTRQ